MPEHTSEERLIAEARGGNREALETLLKNIMNRIFGLSVRMLYNPEDARDATQEILIKIVTGLGKFEGRSSFDTWAYRIAANHLLTMKQRKPEREAMNFDEYRDDLALPAGWRDLPSEGIEREWVEEVRISCLHGLLLCLDRAHRLAFILVDVFGVTSEQGGAILGITAEAFRKRLSRARKSLADFLRDSCGLMDPDNPCACMGHTVTMKDSGRFTPERIIFTSMAPRSAERGRPAPFSEDHPIVNEMEELDRMGHIYRTCPVFRTPRVLEASLQELLASEHYIVFAGEDRN